MMIIGMKELSEKIRLSRTTVYKLTKKGDFPKPFLLGDRKQAWEESDIDDWMRGRYSPGKPTKAITTAKKPAKPKQEASPEVLEIFNYWVLVMKKTGRVALSPKRLTAIQARLSDGYTVSEIKLAIIGCSKSNYHMGFNESKTLYNNIELICRNPEKLEGFRDNHNKVSDQDYENHQAATRPKSALEQFRDGIKQRIREIDGETEGGEREINPTLT